MKLMVPLGGFFRRLGGFFRRTGPKVRPLAREALLLALDIYIADKTGGLTSGERAMVVGKAARHLEAQSVPIIMDILEEELDRILAEGDGK